MRDSFGVNDHLWVAPIEHPDLLSKIENSGADQGLSHGGNASHARVLVWVTCGDSENFSVWVDCLSVLARNHAGDPEHPMLTALSKLAVGPASPVGTDAPKLH